jgi:hypothetical protein
MKNKTINFKVWDGHGGHIFATLTEAEKYRADYIRIRREFYAITETTKPATHKYLITA